MWCCVGTSDHSSVFGAVSSPYHAQGLECCPLSSSFMELLGAPSCLGMGKGSPRVPWGFERTRRLVGGEGGEAG